MTLVLALWAMVAMSAFICGELIGVLRGRRELAAIVLMDLDFHQLGKLYKGWDARWPKLNAWKPVLLGCTCPPILFRIAVQTSMILTVLGGINKLRGRILDRGRS